MSHEHPCTKKYGGDAESVAEFFLSRPEDRESFVLQAWRRYKAEYPDQAHMIVSTAEILFTPEETRERDAWISTFAVEAAIGQLATDFSQYEDELRICT